jgi:hypothetical protein
MLLAAKWEQAGLATGPAEENKAGGGRRKVTGRAEKLGQNRRGEEFLFFFFPKFFKAIFKWNLNYLLNLN